MLAVEQSMPGCVYTLWFQLLRMFQFFFPLHHENQSAGMGKCTGVREGTVNFSVDRSVWIADGWQTLKEGAAGGSAALISLNFTMSNERWRLQGEVQSVVQPMFYSDGILL